ncbi:hypothetical protein MSBRW_0944 [Methanosarcina barkeri str. Wiesmoor]|uniref:Delta-aminolevulinic acid dehydratase n=2 Tax=Methanosarcina barkeri TaxID=2208 RepID=A0A0E3QJH6_METBA|nr:hypothetical protein [Methanosarcina barkeri]AKB50197.1 hypothetical protein MSBRW_0944 [Methanosarcina barkeri str. Wiesmoor]
MTSQKIIWDSIESLHKWVKDQAYYGWDPYDALNSKFILKLCMGSPSLEILATQINKYSIVNFRPLLRVEKGIDVKGMALFAQAYSKMYTLTADENYKNDLLNCMLFLKEKSLVSIYGHDCWAGHYYNFRNSDKSILSPNIPDVITTSNVIKAAVESYKVLKRNDLIKMARSGYEFLTNSLLHESKDGYFYLDYDSSSDGKIVINASAEGLSAICKLMHLFDDKNLKETSYNLAEFLITNQNTDGSWIYSKYNNGKIRIQLDFHQGFIINSLLEYLPFAALNQKDRIISSIKNGAKFYKEKQFFEDGTCHFRYPQKYPIDIHNQAQGIITFSKLAPFNNEFSNFSLKIALWTILNMQNRAGYFYYQKYRIFRNNIPHIRWGQAWMMLALATYLEVKEEQK